MAIERPDYRIYMNDNTWTLNDAINIVFSEQEYIYRTSDAINSDKIDLQARKRDITTALKNNVSIFVVNKPIYKDVCDVDGEPMCDEYGEIKREIDIYNTYIDIKKFIKCVLDLKGVFPKELYEWYLQRSGCIKPVTVAGREVGDNNYQDGLREQEGIKSSETELMQKNLTIPLMKQKIAMLEAEKIKWDASIEAAARVGLLFYENGLEKPSTKDIFVKEFYQHLGEGLHDSTIEKIHKALPAEYKLKGGRPKKNDSSEDIDNIIAAATYAGSIHERREAKISAKLKLELRDNSYPVPSDDILDKITAAVKKIFATM
ncbi:MAG: hypothetical protein ACYC2U_07730 [Candidatus Amoebophilus sp.]